MLFKTGELYHGFRLLSIRLIPELNATARLFSHEKSGARLLHLEADDDNKVFSISFRTPPPDSTGLPHILEHSVLCGSRKFPVKEPFVELAKGSLNTFLNAMTFPDKTMYPIASTNDKDFMNLMDVYLDAVFYPNIYSQPEILMQEGWHYELEDKDAPMSYKGVVYNEMKGAFSSPEQVLFRKIQESLYPDTPYGVDSGGDPEDIPKLTQEQFLSFHKKYYHPSNSYIYLYGDGDILKHLEFIDKEYLKDFDSLDIDSGIPLQQPFPDIRETTAEYSISAGESTEGKTYLSMNFSIGRSTDPFLYLAFDILEYLLADNPAAPLKKALLQAGIGKDVFGSFDNGILQPIFSIVAKDADVEQKEDFKAIVTNTLKELAEKGIDKRLIEAAINYREFKLREADFGGRPKGLIYNIRCMDSWLYDADPTMHLSFEEPLGRVKAALTEPLFEDLIKKHLLENNHCSLLVVKPQPGMAESREREICQKLQEYKASLPEEEINRIVECTRELVKKQSEPDSPEALATIPMISLEDIKAEAEVLPLEERDISGVKTLNHEIHTNGIAYVSLYFDTRAVPEGLLPYAGLLAAVLSEIGTRKRGYEDLANEINIQTGGISFTNQAFPILGSDDDYAPRLIVKAKSLSGKLPELMRLTGEIINETVFDDARRLKEIIQEGRSRLEMGIYSQGHYMAMTRLNSYFSPAGKYNETLTGISFYRFLAGIEKGFDSRKDEIIHNLKTVSEFIFQKSSLMASVVISPEDYSAFANEFAVFADSLPDTAARPPQSYAFEQAPANEGLMTPGKVQYVAKGFSFKKAGWQYTGSLQVLRSIASLDYLWNRIRVQGGAYGAFANFSRSGAMIFVSYRDPNLKETLAAYDQMVQYLEGFDADNREMAKYIIGTISRLDTPLTPQMKGERAVSNYLSGVTQADIQLERDEVLKTTPQDIRGLAPMLQDVLKNEYICVLGSESKLKDNKDIFKNIINVFE